MTRLRSMAAWGLTVTLVCMVLLPIYWGIRTSFTTSGDLSFFPSHFSFENYYRVLFEGQFLNSMLNSLIVSIGAVVVTMPLAVLGAYALARFNFAGRRYGAVLLALPLLPAVAVLVPLIVYIRRLGLYDTLYAVILGASVFTLPFATWMVRSFMLAVPKAVEEAALTDGCTSTKALVRVLLPLIAPGIITVSMFVFITAWNNYIYAAAFTTSDELQVVPVAILGFISGWGRDYAGMDAAATLAVLPPLILFLAFQKWFIKGLLAGAGR